MNLRLESEPELEIGYGGYFFIKGTMKRWHRHVCRKYHGKFPNHWVVHHIDGNKINNDPNNLIAMPRKMHDYLHRRFRKKNLPNRLTILSWLNKENAKDIEGKKKQGRTMVPRHCAPAKSTTRVSQTSKTSVNIKRTRIENIKAQRSRVLKEMTEYELSFAAAMLDPRK